MSMFTRKRDRLSLAERRKRLQQLSEAAKASPFEKHFQLDQSREEMLSSVPKRDSPLYNMLKSLEQKAKKRRKVIKSIDPKKGIDI